MIPKKPSLRRSGSAGSIPVTPDFIVEAFVKKKMRRLVRLIS